MAKIRKSFWLEEDQAKEIETEAKRQDISESDLVRSRMEIFKLGQIKAYKPKKNELRTK